MRLLLHRIARGLITMGGLIRPRLGWVLLTFFLVTVISVETVALIAPLIVARMTDNRAPVIPTSVAVESFLQGQARYDADMMWESLSPHLQASLTDQGVSRDDFAAKSKSDRDGGKTYTKASYIGGVNLPENQKMYFYTVDVALAESNQVGIITFIFTVDRSGKIIDISNP
ncbi:MAG: hypothetical protein HGA19_23190 [Oscillochloris sp.]|nr:hypothetical protein [Oscillochloris sp.]